MKNKRVVESFHKIRPGEERLEHILDAAYERADSKGSSPEKMFTRKRIFSAKRLIPIAVCLAVVIAVSIGGYTAAADAKEYKKAVAFFNANGLTTDGLTRAEIKEVYRDISTGRFTSDKTAKVLEKRVGGYEIAQNEPSPEDLEKIWNNLNSAYKESIYRMEYNEVLDPDLGFIVLKNSVFNKFDSEGRVIWSSTFDNLFIDEYAASGDYVAVYGFEPSWSSTMPSIARVALIKADDGTILWDKELLTGYDPEYVKDIVFDGDKITVFAEGDFRKLIVLQYDTAGNHTLLAENELGGRKFTQQVVKLGDGYLARLRRNNGEESIVKIGADGKIADTFTYSSVDTEYYIVDMEEYSGRVYLSAYAVPKLKDGAGSAGGRHDIADILNEIFEQEDWEISSRELTERMRGHFTAVLLVCDTENGIPQEFFSVKGSIGDVLEVTSDGGLTWDVGSISDSLFSPMTSSFSIQATCLIYRYEFDGSGNLVGQDQTEEVIYFRR